MLFFLIALSLLASAKDLAVVNGSVISDTDYNQALSGFPVAQRNSVNQDPNARRQVIQNLIDQELLVQAAVQAKLNASDDFKNAVEAFKKQYLANRLLERKLSPMMGDGQAKGYYQKNKHLYTTDQVHAMHILLTSQDEAQKIKALAEQPSADFQALAEKYSKDPSAKNNRGDIGYFFREQMTEPFSDAAFRAKQGTVVGPVQSPFGYHVIKVIDHKAGTTLGYDEVEVKVKAKLQQELAQRYLTSLRKSAKIELK